MKIPEVLRFMAFALPVIVGAATTGCHLPPLDGTEFMVTSDDVEQPIRWQLVEKRYGDLKNHGASGDGLVDPDATALVFEPLYEEQLTTDIYVSAYPHAALLTGFSHSQAGVGTVVTAEVRVRDAALGGVYRLTAKGSNDFIKILGENPIFLSGKEVGEFRFTSTVSGRGGVAIAVDRVD